MKKKLHVIGWLRDWAPWWVSICSTVNCLILGTTQRIEILEPFYFAIMLPLIIALALNADRVFTWRGWSSGLLLSYALFISIISFARGDLASIPSTILLCCTLSWLMNAPSWLTLKRLNVFFLVCVVLGVAAYLLLDINYYGILPGSASAEYGRSRVSLFPTVSSSGSLALIVFMMNWMEGHDQKKWLWLTLSGYFLFASFMRTAIVATVLGVVLFFLLNRLRRLTAPWWFATAILLLVSFIAMTSAAYLLSRLGLTDNQMVRDVLLRGDESRLSERRIEEQVFRGFLWKQHLYIASKNPLFGVGTFNFMREMEGTLQQGQFATGSESLLTFLLARFGLLTLPLLLFLVYLYIRAAKKKYSAACVFSLVLWIVMLAYGSVLHPTNFFFIFSVGACLHIPKDPDTTAVISDFARPTSIISPLGSVGRSLQ